MPRSKREEKPSVETVELESSHLVSARYDSEASLLEIEFKDGSVYEYEDVDQATFDGLKHAPSKGKYFWKHIR